MKESTERAIDAGAFVISAAARVYQILARRKSETKMQPVVIPDHIQSRMDQLDANRKASLNQSWGKLASISATSTETTPTTKESATMKFNSILSAVGDVLKKVFTIGIETAQAAEPAIDILFPGIALLYNRTVAAVADAEAKAIAAGKQSGSGRQKLAMVVSAIEDEFKAYAEANAWSTSPTTQHIETWINAVVATLNAMPAVPGETPAS